MGPFQGQHTSKKEIVMLLVGDPMAPKTARMAPRLVLIYMRTTITARGRWEGGGGWRGRGPKAPPAREAGVPPAGTSVRRA